MKARLDNLWDAIHSSYWFVPALMTLGAIILSVILVMLDHRVGPQWLERISWLESNTPEGARELLSTVAGSMITVAGVTFSITIASVSLASQQYGPRLLTNFMRDRGNQIVLGTFVATFVYCLLVLRTIYDGDETSFVPNASVTVALLLTLASLGVLIYFIHHISESLKASSIVASVGRDLIDAVDNVFPAAMGLDASSYYEEPISQIPERFDAEAAPIASTATGYLQSIDQRGLIALTRRRDVVVQLRNRPGDFIARGNAVARVWPPDRLTPDLQDALLDVFIIGNRRTSLQDVRFPINELVEITARALSSGINDPFTAISAIDWLGVGMRRLMEHPLPEAFRCDPDGKLRVITSPSKFDDFVDAAFGHLRPYAITDKNVALHLLEVLFNLAHHGDQEQRRNLLEQARRVVEAGQSALTQATDRHEVEEFFQRQRGSFRQWPTIH